MRTVEDIQLEINKVEKALIAAEKKCDRCENRLRELREELAEARKKS